MRTLTTQDARATGSDGRSLGSLFKELRDGLMRLVRQELELARAELAESVRSVARHAGLLGAGVAVGLLGAMAVVAALGIGAAVLLDLWLPVAVAIWLGPLLVGVILLLVSMGMVQAGRSRLGGDSLRPRLTEKTLKENREWIRDRLT